MELPEPQQQRILVYVSMSGMTQLNPEIQAVCMTDPSLEQVLSSFRRLKGISRLRCWDGNVPPMSMTLVWLYSRDSIDEISLKMEECNDQVRNVGE